MLPRKLGRLEGIKVEKRGFWDRNGDWVNLNGKVTFPQGSLTFYTKRELDTKRTKQKLQEEYQNTLSELYKRSFPDYYA